MLNKKKKHRIKWWEMEIINKKKRKTNQMVRNEIGKKEMMNRPASRLIPFDELNMKYRNWFFFFFFSSVCVCVWNIKWFPYHRSIYWEWNNNQTGKKELTKLLFFFFPTAFGYLKWGRWWQVTAFGLLLLCRHSKQLCHFLWKKNPRHSSPGNSHRRGSVVVVGGAVVHLMMM